MWHTLFSIQKDKSWPANLAALPTNGLHPTTREILSYFVILWKTGKNWGQALKCLIMLKQKLYLLNTTPSRFFQRRSWRRKRIEGPETHNQQITFWAISFFLSSVVSFSASSDSWTLNMCAPLTSLLMPQTDLLLNLARFPNINQLLSHTRKNRKL